MKILLIYTNRFRFMSPPPAGLSYLVKPLQEQGHEVRILDLMFSKQPVQEIENALQSIPDQFDDEFFGLLKKAGGIGFTSSVDSFSDAMLANYQKPFRSTDIESFSKLAKKYGIHFIAELLFGGPGETNETIKESMAFLPNVEYSRLEYAIGVRINPGTAVCDTAIKEGIINDASELLFPKFYISKDVDVPWAKKFIDQNIKKYASRNMRMLPMIMRNILDIIF